MATDAFKDTNKHSHDKHLNVQSMNVGSLMGWSSNINLETSRDISVIPWKFVYKTYCVFMHTHF